MPNHRNENTGNDAYPHTSAYPDASAYSRDKYEAGGSKRAHGRAGQSADQVWPNPLSTVADDKRQPIPIASDRAQQAAIETEQATDIFTQPASAEEYHDIAQKRHKRRTAKRVIAVVCAVILVAVAAVGAYALWFTSSLDQVLAPDDESLEELNKVLVPTVPDKPFYMLLLGSDSREGHSSGNEAEQGDNERSDVIMLVRVDLKNKKMTLLSIPRDTPHKFDNGTYGKINEVYNYEGASGTIKAVSELTGVDIAHYAEVRISGLRAIVDLLGGVTVDVPIALEYHPTNTVDHIRINPGVRTLNGEEAEIFARARHNYKTEEDVHRQDAVRQLLMAIMKQTLDRPITEIPPIVLQEAQYVNTDLKSGDIVSLALGVASVGKDMKIYSGTGPTDGDNNPQADGQWMCFENPEGWKEVMEVVDAGEDPSGRSFSATSIPWQASSTESESGE